MLVGDGGEAGELLFEFVCECARRRCYAMVPLTVREYETVRRDPAAFVVAPGHEIASIEHAEPVHARYTVVRKFHPEPIRIAVEQDPRAARS